MKIDLDNNQINNICNALNTHAKHFDDLAAKGKPGSSEDTKAFWAEHARELREITNHILRQRQDAERVDA
jgi:hypothetical protein